VGNQLFAYVFARGYALAHGCELQIPADWWGRKVFKDADSLPPISVTLPQTERDDVTKRPLNRWFGRTDIDINVFAQSQIYLDYYSRKQVREWLAFKPEWEQYAPHVRSTVAHYRRGDYTQEFSRYYCTVSDRSYVNAFTAHSTPWPVINIYDGWREAPESLPPDLGWLQDFLIMRDAPTLLRANSTFSWWAATLGHGKVYSPVVGDKVGLQDCVFVEGNWPCTAGKFSNQSDLHLKEV